jgi:hypothetical protein
MILGQETRSTALPTKAGLKMFCPNPPNICFPKKMATPPPTRGIQKGQPGGRESPRSIPVTTALQSPMDKGRRKRRQSRASKPTQAKIERRRGHRANPTPKNAIPHTAAGRRAKTT